MIHILRKKLKTKSGQNIIVIGDCINVQLLEELFEFSKEVLIKLKGVFTLIILEKDAFGVYSSMFSMLPIYYSENYTSISNSLDWIQKVENLKKEINKRFILESYLFNYAFSNQTYLKEIKRLNSFYALTYLNNEITQFKVEEISEWFPKKHYFR